MRPTRDNTIPLTPYKSSLLLTTSLLCLQAHNGSGKTTCFVLSMLSRVEPSLRQPQVCFPYWDMRAPHLATCAFSSFECQAIIPYVTSGPITASAQDVGSKLRASTGGICPAELQTSSICPYQGTAVRRGGLARRW